jgi:hypothetical protein
VQHDVERLEVAVDDAVRVQVAHARGDRDEPLEDLPLAEVATTCTLFEQCVVQIALRSVLEHHH